MSRILSVLLLLGLAAALAACSGQRSAVLFPEENVSVYDKPSPIVASDPDGPITAPSLPASLKTPSARNVLTDDTPGSLGDKRPGSPSGNRPGDLPGGRPEAPGKAAPSAPGIRYEVIVNSPDAPELAETFAKTSNLYTLGPPETLTGLEQRLNASLQDAKKILQSYGYYSGTVEGRIEAPGSAERGGEEPGGPPGVKGEAGPGGKKVLVHVDFLPGPRYGMGKTEVEIVGKACVAVFADGKPVMPLPEEMLALLCAPSALPSALPSAPDDSHMSSPLNQPGEKAQAKASLNRFIPPPLPKSLEDVGLAAGAPAVAGDVLDAADRVLAAFHNNGYPFAAMVSTRYVIDRSTRTLDATLRLNPGEFIRMGDLRPGGEPNVSLGYLKAKQNWKKGQPWNQELVEAYQESLRQSGLFRSIDIKPAPVAAAPEEQEAGEAFVRPVLLTLEGLPERTVGGSLKYNSDLGPGLQAYWEHRNITGSGGKLRVEAPVWTDLQEISADFRQPYFFDPKQDFTAHAALLHQDTDAYRISAGQAYIGLDRRLASRWTGSLKASLEGGDVKEPEKERHSYYMWGFPLGLAYNSTQNPLNATSGMKLLFSVGPYGGEYNGNFDIIRSRLDASVFYPLAGEDKFVLAARTSFGGIWGAKAADTPTTARFYSGGGGSVRGYKYQSLGPRNDRDDPEGGTYLFECSLEGRYKFTQEWGMAAFVDGGTVSENFDSGLSGGLQWGAGLGLRYYTAIGPVRIDLATPLNPRDDDDRLQVYISIGQSF